MIKDRLHIALPPGRVYAPLVAGLAEQADVVPGAYATDRLTQGIASAEFDAVLIPPGVIPCTKGLRIIPGLGVFSTGHAAGPRLTARCDRAQLQRIFASADLAAMAQVAASLLAEEGVKVVVCGGIPEGPYDGELAEVSPMASGTILDLNLSEWWEVATGLPLPWAVWVGGRAYSDLRRVLARTAQTAMEMEVSIPGMRYTMGVDEMDALRCVAKLLHRHGYASSPDLPPLC